jgi:hypothetical protein
MMDLSEKRRERFLASADKILREIDRLSAVPDSTHREGLDDQDLETARSKVVLVRAQAESRALPPKGERYWGITRLIMDQWPLRTSLGDALSELESMYEQL